MIFTVGHSTHGADELASILSGIDVLMDIRSHPTSRWPQHTKPELERWVPAAGIEYRWEPRLGGWTAADVEEWGELMAGKGVDLAVYARGAFPKQHISRKLAPRSVPTWTNRGLYDYSWFTALPSFLDSYNVGVFEGAIAACERQGRVRVKLRTFCDGDVLVEWW